MAWGAELKGDRLFKQLSLDVARRRPDSHAVPFALLQAVGRRKTHGAVVDPVKGAFYTVRGAITGLQAKGGFHARPVHRLVEHELDRRFQGKFLPGSRTALAQPRRGKGQGRG